MTTHESPPLREVFNREEAAEFARVSPSKIDQWIALGLKSVRTGSEAGKPGPANVIVMRKHLLAWIESLAEAKPARPASSTAEADAPRKPKRGRPPQAAARPPEAGKWLR